MRTPYSPSEATTIESAKLEPNLDASATSLRKSGSLLSIAFTLLLVIRFWIPAGASIKNIPITTKSNRRTKLSKKREYGEVSREALKIATRTELLGLDIFTAVQQVARMSPSVEWQKFLQGAVATSSAGSRLKPYFVTKATEYQNKLRVSLKKNAESVSIFAETYVTIGVAFPLFMIVILAVMAVIAQNTSGMSMLFLILISFLVMPVMIATFLFLMSSVNREVRIS